MKQDQKDKKQVDLLDESYLDRKNQKLRITSWIDGDIYDELQKRAEAGEANGKYQKLMNMILRSALGLDGSEPVEVEGSEIMTLDQLFKKYGLNTKKVKVPKSGFSEVKSQMRETPQLFTRGVKVPAKGTKKKVL